MAEGEHERWDIFFMPRAERDLDRLMPKIVVRVYEALERYAGSGTGDIKRLANMRTPEWRLRVGDYRIRFERDEAARRIVVLRALHRREAYRD